jgi:hypothetical protein
VSSGFGEPAKPKTLNELIPFSTTVAQGLKGYKNGKHIDAFGLINMNGRIGVYSTYATESHSLDYQEP